MLTWLFRTQAGRLAGLGAVCLLLLAVLLRGSMATKLDLSGPQDVRVISGEVSGSISTPLAAIIGGGEVYVADSANHRIQVLDADGRPRFQFDGRSYHDAKGGELLYPTGIAISEAGEIFVADSTGGKIAVFTAKGRFARRLKLPDADGRAPKPLALAFDRYGRLHVTEARGGRVLVFDRSGQLVREFANGRLSYPNGIAVDRNGRIYVTDSNHGRVLVLDRLGVTQAEWRLRDKQQFMPRGIAIDKHDRVIVADTLNSRIIIFDRHGQPLDAITTLANGDRFFLPHGVSVDADDNVVVTDRGAKSILMFKLPEELPPSS